MRAADLSDWNAPAEAINWPIYRAWSAESGSESCLIFKATEGNGVTMKNWRGYLDAVNANHLTHAIHYHFARPDLGNRGVDEADYFLGVVAGALEPGSLCMLDLEEPEAAHVSIEWIMDWLNTVEDVTKTVPAIYASTSFVQEHLSSFPALARYSLGLAQWGPQPQPPAPWSTYLWWQFTDKLIVPGIPGTVDANQFYGWPGQPIPSNAKVRTNRMLIQHPTDNARLDLVYVGTDGNVWHSENKSDGLQGLCADAAASAVSLGHPVELAPLSLSASWDNTGQFLNIVVAGKTGAIYALCLKEDGSLDMNWTQITGQTFEVAVAV